MNKVGILYCHPRGIGSDRYYPIKNPQELRCLREGTVFDIRGLDKLRVIRVDRMGDDLGDFIICVRVD